MTGIYNMMKKRYRAAGLLALLFPCSRLVPSPGGQHICFPLPAGKGDFVTVCFTLPVAVSRQDQPEIKKTPGTAATDAGLKKETQTAIKESVTVEEILVTQEVPTEVETVTKEPALPADDYSFSFRANLLRWATLISDVGCTHADYEKYTVVDGVRVKRGKENRNYWGVNHAGITLVWKLK